jgi:hypothetical protein
MKSQYGQYLYFVAGDLTVTFVFHLYSTSRWQYITLAWTEVPYYQDKFVFFFRNAIVPTHPTVLGRDPLPFATSDNYHEGCDQEGGRRNYCSCG